VDGGNDMNNNDLSGRAHGNLSAGAQSAESETAHLVARARTMMMISGLTTALAIAAVVGVIGYRMMTTGTGAIGGDGIVTLPKGARVLSTAASGGRVAVLFDVAGSSELRTFDIKTLKETGRLRFVTEQ
jgi:hypothetical protein